MKRFEKEYRITADNMDMDYHVTPNALLIYLQDTIATFLASRHLAAFDVIDDDLLWVITDFKVDVDPVRPLWPSAVKVQLWTSELTSIKAYFDFRMMDEDGRDFCHGSSCWAIIDSLTRKPCIRTEEYLCSRLEVDPEFTLGNHGKIVFPTSGDTEASYDYKTMMPDVDFNGHVSNRQYTLAAMACEDLEFERTHTPVSIRVKYSRETMLGDTIHCRMALSEVDPAEHVYFLTNDAGAETCRILVRWAPQPLEPLAVRANFRK